MTNAEAYAMLNKATYDYIHVLSKVDREFSLHLDQDRVLGLIKSLQTIKWDIESELLDEEVEEA